MGLLTISIQSRKWPQLPHRIFQCRVRILRGLQITIVTAKIRLTTCARNTWRAQFVKSICAVRKKQLKKFFTNNFLPWLSRCSMFSKTRGPRSRQFNSLTCKDCLEENDFNSELATFICIYEIKHESSYLPSSLAAILPSISWSRPHFPFNCLRSRCWPATPP